MLTKDQLHICMPHATADNLERFIQPLNDTMERFAINTPVRQTNFIAQVAHESGELLYTRELSTGAAYDTGKLAATLGNTPEPDGDGEKYKGRGLIQLTGKRNYQNLSTYFKQDFLNHPELLEGPVWASLSAGWFWSVVRNLNAVCELPDSWVKTWNGKTYSRFQWITLLINGGQNGLAQRLRYYELAKTALI